jgi:hypothetical protein
MAKNKIEIKSKDSDGKSVTMYVLRPTNDDQRKAQLVGNRTFKEALTSGAMLKSQLMTHMREQGLWDDDKQKRSDEFEKTIKEGLLKLKKGGIPLSEAKEVAINVRAARIARTLLETQFRELDEFTVESQVDNAKFDFLLVRCVKDKKGNQIFENVEDYHNKQEEPYAAEAANSFANLFYGLDPNWEADLPENKFLLKYKLVDENLRLVDSDGHYVTSDGKLLNEDFQYVDKDGNLVDEDGNRIDEDGLPLVEFSPFLDDNGNPIQ